jgi:predicted acetylornithine/succinylornithine family transaminase
MGVQTTKWIKKGERVLMGTYARFPMVLTKGVGATVTDIEGKRYLDFVGGIAVNSLGHCDPKQVQAIYKQAQTLLHVSNLYYNLPQIALAEWIVSHSFADKVFFANSGAEANEGAIKLARKYAKTIDPNRFEIISAEGSFHGRTLATVAATGQAKYHKGFEPLPPGFKHVPFDDPAAIEKAITPQTAAILLEPIQGEGGVRVPSQNYLREVRALCNRYHLLLILDEVQTGMGRTGTLFAYEQAKIVPDILTLAKGLGGGFPIGALLANEAVAAAFTPGTHASTFGGNPLACSSALAVVKRLTPPFLKTVREKGSSLSKKLLEMKKRGYPIKAVRGKGLLVAVDLIPDALTLIQQSHRAGLLLSKTSEHTIRMSPPLTVTSRQIDQAISILQKVLHV